MSDDQVESLANLLEHSINSVVVTHGHSKQQIDVPTYRRLLQRHWDRHWPDLDLNHPRYYTPVLDSGEMQQRLLAALNNDLDQYVRDGRVQTAAIVTVGGYGPGFTLADLVGRLLEVAIGRGSRHAACAFYQGISETHIAYRRMALLTGVRLDLEVPVRPGIRMVPLPSSTADLPSYFPHMSFMDSGDLLGRTLIVVDYTVQPTFADPAPLSLPEDVFQRQQECSELPDFDVHQFCDALSLANGGPIVCTAEWTHVDPDAVFIPRRPYTGAEVGYPRAPRSRRSVLATANSVEEAVSLYKTRRSLSPGLAQKLEVPINRWVKSQTDETLVDAFIDLGIALESLYLDAGQEAELGFTLRLRAGWFLGNSVDERNSVMNEIRDIYGLRSRAVHRGQVPHNQETLGLKDRGVQLCLRSIVKKIHYARAHGEFPNWNRLVLGGSG